MTSGAIGVDVGPAVGRGVAVGSGVLVTCPADGVPTLQAESRIMIRRRARRARKVSLQIEYGKYFTLNKQRRRKGVSVNQF